MIINCWPDQALRLPASVAAEAESVEPGGRYFVPFWLVAFDVSVKFPLAKRRETSAWLAVNALSGDIVYPPAVKPVETEASEKEAPKPRLSWRDMDESRCAQAINGGIRSRARAWADVSYTARSAEVVYKKILVWRVKFKNGQNRRIALDTLSGEYGILDDGQ